MKVKDLLRVIFRIFGIYTILNLIVNFLPSQITYLINSKIYFPFQTENAVFQTYAYIGIVVLFTIISFYFLIINPEFIIKNLKPKSFLENHINFEKLNPESLVQIAMVSLGILLLFDSVPELINKGFLWFKIINMNSNTNLTNDISDLTLKSEFYLSLAKVILGFVFIIFQNSIGKYLYRQNVEKTSL